MAYNITLSSSMRSNLLSLRNISTLMNKTHNILSTGKKVNSAIDNATSYYQARSLTHRAADLNNLLDSMSQGIQTINAALEGLERYDKFLEQATIIAEETYEKAVIPTKDWILSQIGENGAVVSTAQELKDAIASNKETICVYGKIDYFEDETITLKEGQKLVGTEYFTGYSGKERFSEINFKGNISSGINVNDNCVLSDLDLNIETSADVANLIEALDISFTLRNLDLTYLGRSTLSKSQGVVSSKNSEVMLSGIINVNSSGRYGNGLHISTNSRAIINKDCELNFKTLTTDQNLRCGVVDLVKSTIDVYGKINVENNNGAALWFERGTYSGGVINFYKGSELTCKTNIAGGLIVGNKSSETSSNILNLEEGVIFNIKDSTGTASAVSKGYNLINNSSDIIFISANYLKNNTSFILIDDQIDWANYNPVKERAKQEEYKILAQDMNRYEKILNQLDDMVGDSSYQGVNLLKGDDLTLAFNESREHNFVIKGIDMHTMSAGITTRTWETKEDISNSIKEIKEAVNKVRQTTEKLGNNLSIIQTRQSFTEALSDILEVGADKLTLADMNETSAEYLMLQTRQQLAINSLSLASQSAKSILSLF